MKTFMILTTLFSALQVFAGEVCVDPAAAKTVYLCEKILQQQENLPPQIKIKTARIRVWLQKEGETQGLCVVGDLSTNDSLVPGKYQGFGESKYLNVTKKTDPLATRELIVTDDEWRLVETHTDQVMKAYPKYPRTMDRFRMDLKKSEFTEMRSTLEKTYAPLTLACVVEKTK